jgi:YggT family protein
VQRFVSVFVWVYILLIFAYVLSSWIRAPLSLQPLVRFLHDVCEPYLRLFRRVLPSLGPVDVSPIVAVFALYVALYLVNDVLLDTLR